MDGTLGDKVLSTECLEPVLTSTNCLPSSDIRVEKAKNQAVTSGGSIVEEEIIMETAAVSTTYQCNVLGDIGEDEQGLLDGMRINPVKLDHKERHSAEAVKRKKKISSLKKIYFNG